MRSRLGPKLGLLLGDPSAARLRARTGGATSRGRLGALIDDAPPAPHDLHDHWNRSRALVGVGRPSVAHFCGHMISGGERSWPSAQLRRAPRRRPDRPSVIRRPGQSGSPYGSLRQWRRHSVGRGTTRCGAELHVVLPCAIEDFLGVSVSPSGPQWVERFHECLEAAVSVTYTTEGRFLGSSSPFSGTGAEFGHWDWHCSVPASRSGSLQLALWDGAPPSGTVDSGRRSHVASDRARRRDGRTNRPCRRWPSPEKARMRLRRGDAWSGRF